MKTFLFFISTLITVKMYAQPGSFDKTFGNQGSFLDTSLQAAYCQAMALQHDGKILIGGYTDTVSINGKVGGLLVGRYNTDGSIDETFGINGKVIIRIIGRITIQSPKALVVQSDGKIVVLARVVPDILFGDVGLLRFQANGFLDSTFGVNGFVMISMSPWQDLLGGMVLQPDGKIVIAGNKESADLQPGPDFLLRFLSNGSIDESFGNAGQVLTSYSSNVTLGAVLLQPDGKIVTGGTYGVNVRQLQLVRYNADGTLDSGFGMSGVARLRPSSGYFYQVNGLALQDNGKILATGSYGDISMMLARFTADGKPDVEFGNTGEGYAFINAPEVYDVGKSVFFTPAKKIIVTGLYASKPEQQVAVVQFDNTGNIDSSFGENGIAPGGFVNTFGSDITSGAGLLQQDGKVLLSGSFFTSRNGLFHNIGLLRYNGDPTRRQILIAKIRHWIQRHNGIEWDYNNEISSYVVQRSSDGIHFNSIAKINTSNTSNCTYEDASSLSGTNYYRLQTTIVNGDINYSNVIAITNDDIEISPNPATNILHMQGLSSNKIKITVVDFAGNVTISQQLKANGNSSYNLNIESLKQDNYLLKIEINDEVVTKQFVKE